MNARTEMDEEAFNATDIGKPVSAVSIVPVRLRSAEGEVQNCTMLDACSTGSFVLKDIVFSPGVKGAETQLMVKTVNGTKLYDAKVLNGLVVSDLKGDNTVQLPMIFTKKDLCTCPKALEPIDVLASKDGGLFAIKTFAGWEIVGPLYMCNREHPAVDCNRVAAVEVCSGRHLHHHFMVEKEVRKIVTAQTVNEMLELDFSERADYKELGYSQEGYSAHRRWSL